MAVAIGEDSGSLHEALPAYTCSHSENLVYEETTLQA